MRANGIDERFCTGNASDKEKFMKWTETVPATFTQKSTSGFKI